MQKLINEMFDRMANGTDITDIAAAETDKEKYILIRDYILDLNDLFITNLRRKKDNGIKETEQQKEL